MPVWIGVGVTILVADEVFETDDEVVLAEEDVVVDLVVVTTEEDFVEEELWLVEVDVLGKETVIVEKLTCTQ